MEKGYGILLFLYIREEISYINLTLLNFCNN